MCRAGNFVGSIPTTPTMGVTLPNKELLTLVEVATYLRLSTLTLKRWGKKGILVPIRINSRGDRRYRREKVLEFLGIEEENK